MPFEYPKEIQDQQAKVKRELEKLARMRTEHLIATGQMPSSKPSGTSIRSGGNDSVASPAAKQSQIKST